MEKIKDISLFAGIIAFVVLIFAVSFQNPFNHSDFLEIAANICVWVILACEFTWVVVSFILQK